MFGVMINYSHLFIIKRLAAIIFRFLYTFSVFVLYVFEMIADDDHVINIIIIIISICIALMLLWQWWPSSSLAIMVVKYNRFMCNIQIRNCKFLFCCFIINEKTLRLMVSDPSNDIGHCFMFVDDFIFFIQSISLISKKMNQNPRTCEESLWWWSSFGFSVHL